MWVDRGDRVFTAICYSVLEKSPLFMILFMDAMKRHSKLFRIAMPAAYLLQVIAMYLYYGYFQSTTPIISAVTNSTATIAVVGDTFESQISNALYTIGFLMLSVLV